MVENKKEMLQNKGDTSRDENAIPCFNVADS